MSDKPSALSRVTDAVRLQALALARTGRVYDLANSLDAKSPGVPGFTPFTLSFTHTPEMTAEGGFSLASDMVVGALHAGTHIDALAHIQAEGRIFGGHDATASRSDRGWLKHGMETVSPIISRAVILDAAAARGVERLPNGAEVGVADVKAMLAAAHLTVRPGDVVLVRTGKMQEWQDPAAFNAGAPGVGREAAIYLYEQGMAVLGADNAATEPTPFRDPANTLHRAMLVEAGVHLIENLDLEEICRDGITEGLFIALPLKITGATGSWLRPVVVT